METDMDRHEEKGSATDPVQAELARVGEHTAALLRSAGETAASIVADAERRAAETTEAAEDFAQAVRGSAYAFSQEQRSEAEAEAERLVSNAETEADRILEVARVRRIGLQSAINELSEHRNSLVIQLEQLADSALNLAGRHREPAADQVSPEPIDWSADGASETSAENHAPGDPLDRLRAEIDGDAFISKPPPSAAVTASASKEKPEIGSEYEPRGGRFSALLPPRRRKVRADAEKISGDESESSPSDAAEAPTSTK